MSSGRTENGCPATWHIRIRYRIRLPLGIHGISNRRFQRLVMRRQRPVFQARRNPDPTESIWMKNKRFVAGKSIVSFRAFRRLIVWRLGDDKIWDIIARPLLGLFVPPHEF